MADTYPRRFTRDWQFECGGLKKGPEFKKGQIVLCTPQRAAALDRRGVVEAVKHGKGKAFDEIVTAWRESAGALEEVKHGKGKAFDEIVTAWRESAGALEEVPENAIVAEGDKAADGDDAGDKPGAQPAGDREKGAAARKS